MPDSPPPSNGDDEDDRAVIHTEHEPFSPILDSDDDDAEVIVHSAADIANDRPSRIVVDKRSGAKPASAAITIHADNDENEDIPDAEINANDSIVDEDDIDNDNENSESRHGQTKNKLKSKLKQALNMHNYNRVKDTHALTTSSTSASAGNGTEPSNDVDDSKPPTFFTVLVAGCGFACDAYDLFIMNVVLVVMGCAMGNNSEHICKLPTTDESALATAVLIGSIIGQLLFGVLADYIGRRKGFIATLSLLIVGATLSSAAQDTGSLSLITVLALCRFILGVGVGGEYPLSATVSSEASVQAKGRGRRVSLVFSMQGVGLLSAPLVVLALLSITNDYDLVWRLALGLGALPGLCMLYFRFQMKETAAYQASNNETNSSTNTNSVSKLSLLRAHSRDLFGTAMNWFLFDIVFYANGLFSSKVSAKFLPSLTGDSSDIDKHQYLVSVSEFLTLLGLCALPGYYVSVLLIDRIGRRNLQLFGYGGMTIVYLTIGLLEDHLFQYKGLFYFLYGLSFFFCNCGPNVTTFVIPSEIFPTSIRATGHGLSAACGKAGAAIGSAIYPVIYDSSGESLLVAMVFSSAVSLLGFVFTFVITRETKDQQLVDTHTDTSTSANSTTIVVTDTALSHSMPIANPTSRKSKYSLKLKTFLKSKTLHPRKGYDDLLALQTIEGVSDLEDEDDEIDFATNGNEADDDGLSDSGGQLSVELAATRRAQS